MPATTLAPAAAPQGGSQAQAPVALVPFVRAAQEHVEPFYDTSYTLTAQSQQIGPIDIPAYGYARGIFIEIIATGGAGTAAIAQPDAPFSALSDVALFDVNGAPLYGPLSGFDTYAVNKYGGYKRGRGKDPKALPDALPVQTSGNFSMYLYVPIEVNGRDGLGALANMNGASTYKLRMTLAALNQIYSANPTTIPAVRIRCFLDAWTQPTQLDLRGNPQATEPPAHGTTSYWSKQTFNVSAGLNVLKMQRVGNALRDVIYIWRDASGVRQSASFPGPLDTYWDTRLLKSLQPAIWRQLMAQRFDLSGTIESAGALDTGVFVEDYMHEFDGLAGFELRDGWLWTAQSTRLEVQGNFSAPGQLTVLTNDVSPAGEVFVG